MAIWAGVAASAISPGRVGLVHSGSTGGLVWLERGREWETPGMMAGVRQLRLGQLHGVKLMTPCDWDEKAQEGVGTAVTGADLHF